MAVRFASALFALTFLLACSGDAPDERAGDREPANTLTKRVSARDGWSFAIGTEFELVESENAVQVIHGSRIVYVSSMDVRTGDVPTSAKELLTISQRTLRSPTRLEHATPTLLGQAEINPTRAGWDLVGVMCADGAVATCLISFASEPERAWAIAVWRSLRYDPPEGD